MTWIIMPVLAGPSMTEAALADCLAQSVPTRILVINQGVDNAFRLRLERLAEEYSDWIFLWSHVPSLPSLAASWNRALDFVWECGGTEALVVNNDVRLHRQTVHHLSTVRRLTDAFFVSSIGVTPEQFDATLSTGDLYQAMGIAWDSTGIGVIDQETGITSLADLQKGGPDFSCYLISKECHEKYRFDEAFIPAFCEDLDLHRRLMLAGDGDKIFSINLPFLHLSSQTLKQVGEEKRQAINRSIESGSRAHYAKKWGGGVNQETFYSPFDPDGSRRRLELEAVGPTTPELQAWYRTQDADIPF